MMLVFLLNLPEVSLSQATLLTGTALESSHIAHIWATPGILRSSRMRSRTTAKESSCISPLMWSSITTTLTTITSKQSIPTAQVIHGTTGTRSAVTTDKTPLVWTLVPDRSEERR